jgi:hypothetical protein
MLTITYIIIQKKVLTTINMAENVDIAAYMEGNEVLQVKQKGVL